MKVTSLSRIIVGGGIAVVGLGFLLHELNVFDFKSIAADWWPIIFVLAGLASLLTNPKSPIWPSFVIGAGILLILRNLGVLEFNAWGIIWPLALVLLGLSYIFDKLSPGPKNVDESKTDIVVMFSGVDSNNKSSNYTGGRINALFGGVKLDLGKAHINKMADLEIFTAFGGLELIVPENWTVHTNGLPLFGGWEDKTTKPKTKNAPALNVKGTCLFGGVEIKN